MSGAPTNYSTTISADKTIGEMQNMLADAGAMRIGIDYEGGVPTMLSFAIKTEIGVRLFRMPVDIDAMHRLLQEKERKGLLKAGLKSVRSSREQAARVGWRLMKDWLGAQLAIIESGMVTLEQVMLPYLMLNELSLYENYKQDELAALVSPR